VAVLGSKIKDVRMMLDAVITQSSSLATWTDQRRSSGKGNGAIPASAEFFFGPTK